MRPSRLLSAPLSFALAVLTFSAVAAPPVAAASASDPTEARLHQAYRACGKKWARQAQRLSQDQLRWMLARSHRVYHVDLGGARIATVEILSGASFRSCDVLGDWDKRETSVRMTLFQPDGSTRVWMSNFAIDDVFFNGEPVFYPQIGRVLLRGVDLGGQDSSRWVDVEPMRTLYAQHVARRDADGARPAPAAAPVLTASLD